MHYVTFAHYNKELIILDTRRNDIKIRLIRVSYNFRGINELENK